VQGSKVLGLEVQGSKVLGSGFKVQGARFKGFGFRVLGSGFWVQGSRLSTAVWLKNGQPNQKRNFEKANIEYRIMNFECRRNVFYPFDKERLSEAIPPFEILRFNIRYSAVRF